MEDFYILGFEKEATDGTVIETMLGATPLRFIIGTIGALESEARQAEKFRGARLKLYRLVEVGDVLTTDEEKA